MKPGTLINSVGKLERKRTLTDLLDAIEGMPLSQRTSLMSRVMKEVLSGTISPAEANKITKAMRN